MCFVVETLRIRDDSTRKLNLTHYKMKFNSNSYLQNTLLIQIFKKRLDFSVPDIENMFNIRTTSTIFKSIP